MIKYRKNRILRIKNAKSRSGGEEKLMSDRLFCIGYDKLYREEL